MASFTGTFNEFYPWAGARTRLWITQETRKKRRDVQAKDGCPRCARQGVALTTAHVTPRKQVVRAALGITDDDEEVHIDLSDAWAKIKKAHRPFEKAFRYLCEPCHRAEDAGPSTQPGRARRPLRHGKSGNMEKSAGRARRGGAPCGRPLSTHAPSGGDGSAGRRVGSGRRERHDGQGDRQRGRQGARGLRARAARAYA